MRLFHMALTAIVAGVLVAAPGSAEPLEETYLPDTAGSKIVSVATNEPVAAAIIVLTQALAIKETGPQETGSRLGEVYAFSPSFVTVYRDEPTLLTFWILQPDDEHDLMLVDSDFHVLKRVLLPPLQETSYVLTFHHEGVFNFYCTCYSPAMSGQFLVLPPSHGS